MRSPLKVLLILGTLAAASLAAASGPATAATTLPVLDTSLYACSNGVCEVGPGNVGTPFAAGLNVSIPSTSAVESMRAAPFRPAGQMPG